MPRRKSHTRESETTFWGLPRYYTSYEERRLSRCPECKRRHGVFGVLGSFLPYLLCSCGGESCWSPGYGWDGGVVGLKRRKGCVSGSSPLSHPFLPLP